MTRLSYRIFTELEQLDLDLLMAETAEIRSDVENRSRSYGRWCTAGYFLGTGADY